MRVLGIDPGLNITGYAVLDDSNQLPAVVQPPKVVEIGVVRTEAKLSMAQRLKTLGDNLGEVIAQLQPDLVVVEELYSHYGHPKTAIIMGHARGVIYLKAAEAGLEVFSYSATRIKNSVTGHGRASKAQVQQMVSSSLGLSGILEPADASDAVAVALCHIQAVEHSSGVSQ